MQPHRVKSAMRIIEILEYFKENQQRRSLSQIAADLGYPLSSTLVLLKTLILLGYLSYDRQERDYFPTPKVTSLGNWIPMALFGSGTILETLKSVYNATGESVFIGTRNDIYLQYTSTIPSAHALRLHTDEGAIVPLTRSAAGWMLLADLPKDRRENIVRRANIICSVGDRVTLTEMEARIAEIHRQGYATTLDMPLDGGATIVVPLSLRIQKQNTCLALGGVKQRVLENFDRYLEALRKAAAYAAQDEPLHQP